MATDYSDNTDSAPRFIRAIRGQAKRLTVRIETLGKKTGGALAPPVAMKA
jgi:hypothetical protein